MIRKNPIIDLEDGIIGHLLSKTKRNVNVVKQDNRNISLKIPLGKAKLNALVKAWISDGEVNVRLVEKPPTPQDKRDLNYHLFHRKVGHPTLDCYIIRKL